MSDTAGWGRGHLALQEEEDSGFNETAIEALPAPPGEPILILTSMAEEPIICNRQTWLNKLN